MQIFISRNLHLLYFTFFLLTLITKLLSIESRITQKNGKFTDENGRTRIFHGVNVVYKLPPYIPSDKEFDPLLSLNAKEDIFYLKKFGFNLIRLGIIWEAIEKAEGQYDYQLLEKYKNLVNLLGQNGIYTMIDAHQDVISRETCGEGIPVFYVKKANPQKNCDANLLQQIFHFFGACKSMAEYQYKLDENGLPDINECKKQMFGFYHTAPEVTDMFKKLYENENGLLDSFANFWQVVAKTFKDNEYVLGYDIWNEPFPGGIFESPFSMLTPGKPDDIQLIPFYRKVDQKLREIDPNFILMFEPTPFPDVWPTRFINIRGTFSKAPLAPSKSDLQMFNIHSYCCSLDLSFCAEGEPSLESSQQCREHHFRNAAEAAEYSSKFGFGAIISEFGACTNSIGCYTEISSVADAADAYLLSWAYWMFKPFNDFTTICQNDMEGLWNKEGQLQDIKVSALTRSYMTAFQGVPLKMKFFKDEKILVVKFSLDRKIKKPSVVYLNKELNYANGIGIVAWPKGVKVEHNEENYLEIFYEELDNKENKANKANKESEDHIKNENDKEKIDEEIATVVVYPKKENDDEKFVFEKIKQFLDEQQIGSYSVHKIEL